MSLAMSLAGRTGYPAMFLALAACLAASTSAEAAGYGLREWSTTAMGSAYAGSSATGTDASFLAYNPASLGSVSSYDSSVGMIGLFPTSSADYTSATTSASTPAGGDPTPNEFVKTAYVPSLAARMRLAPQWSVGLAIYAPWGLSTGYDTGWAGRYYALQTRLMTLDITPVVAYQITDRISVAVGPQFQYAKGTLSNAVDTGTIGALYSIPGSVPGGQDTDATFKADGWGYGFIAGVSGELTDGITLGLSYRSAVSHTLKGKLDFTLDTAGIGAFINGATGLLADTSAKTTLTTPDTLNFGARVKLAEQWTALFEADWTNWSRFQELRVVSVNPFQPDDVTGAKWKDSWLLSVGAEYAYNNNWTFRGGVAIDQSPIPSATINPRIPDADRTWVSLGVTYRATDSISLAVTYAHLFLPRRAIALTAAQTGNALRGNLLGHSEADANAIGIQLNYRMP